MGFLDNFSALSYYKQKIGQLTKVLLLKQKKIDCLQRVKSMTDIRVTSNSFQERLYFHTNTFKVCTNIKWKCERNIINLRTKKRLNNACFNFLFTFLIFFYLTSFKFIALILFENSVHLRRRNQNELNVTVQLPKKDQLIVAESLVVLEFNLITKSATLHGNRDISVDSSGIVVTTILMMALIDGLFNAELTRRYFISTKQLHNRCGNEP